MGMIAGPVTREMVAAMRRIVPAEDALVEPFGSIVHWTELQLLREGGKNRDYTKRIVPVTCGRGVSPDCRGKRDVQVLRGMGGTEMLTPNCLSAKGCIYSGVCLPCLKVKAYPRLAPGSYVCFGDNNKEGTLFKCGYCGKLRRRRIKEPKEFTGRCLSCAQRATKGSITVRAGEHKGKIPYNCSKCGEENFAWPHQHKSPKWRQLCSKCQEWCGSPPPWQHNALTEDDKLPLTEAPVFLSRRAFPVAEGRPVLVRCVYPSPENDGGICGKDTEFNLKVLRRNWEYATGFCPDHAITRNGASPEVYRAAIRALLGQAQNGSGQKEPAGRPPIDASERITLAVAAVAKEWCRLKDKPFERQLQLITQADLIPYLAEKYPGLAKPGTYDQANKRVSNWFKGCRLKEIFPGVSRPFDSFIEAVLKRLRDGATEAQIASELESYLIPARSAA